MFILFKISDQSPFLLRSSGKYFFYLIRGNKWFVEKRQVKIPKYFNREKSSEILIKNTSLADVFLASDLMRLNRSK